LSFHTFQAMSYTIEVYRGNQQPEKHFGIYALYVMFYPQLVAGPIERPQNILPQFHVKHDFSYEKALQGLVLMAYGLFKKVVVADRLAVYVNAVYGDLDHTATLSMALAIVFFSIQIYCDFSGYTDIARGAARFMGFELMLNFDRPYLATSIAGFWSRWHISLSTWFRDYLYIPLGGNRVAPWRRYSNLFLVFLVSGLWHGANWTFVVWGGLHGLFSVSERLTTAMGGRLAAAVGLVRVPRLHRALKMATVFALISCAWVFFRAKNIDEALHALSILCHWDGNRAIAAFAIGQSPFVFFLNIAVIAMLILSYRLPRSLVFSERGSFLFLLATAFIILLLGTNGTEQFIYFQF